MSCHPDLLLSLSHLARRLLAFAVLLYLYYLYIARRLRQHPHCNDIHANPCAYFYLVCSIPIPSLMRHPSILVVALPLYLHSSLDISQEPMMYLLRTYYYIARA